MYTRSLLLVPLLALCARAAAGSTYYVSTSGSDGNPGTLSQPWRTVQKAASTLGPGDTALVRGGVYQEAVTVNVSGAAGAWITIRSHPGETAVLDGASLTVPDADNALFLLLDRSYVAIRGFELRNYRTTTPGRVPVGIAVLGTSHHVAIEGNVLHHIGSDAPVDGDLLGRDANAIRVAGTSATAPITDLFLEGNEVYALTLGSSEAVTIGGNVDGFTVANNAIHDVDNIALDVIGFEGIAPDPGVDFARNGVVRGNRVWNVTSYGNPAYGSVYAAGGIYVDGGADVVIEGNRVWSCDIGVELASEHAGRYTDRVTVRSNFVWANRLAGVALGGYDTLRGGARDCVLAGNTLFGNDTTASGSGELWLQYDVRNLVASNNVFFAGAQELFVSNAYTQNTGASVDRNLWFGAGGSSAGTWEWKGVTYTGFAAYRAGTGNDSTSLFADPLLADAAAGDLHLSTGSPAIDAGAALAAAGSTDIDGQARVQGSAADIGADERSAAAAGSLRTLPPCRVLDTREAAGPYGGPPLAAGEVRTFAFAGRCGVTSAAAAVAANVTAVHPAASGVLRAYSADQSAPVSTVISFTAGRVRANNAILRLSGDASRTLAVKNESAGPVDIIVDVSGTFE